MADLPAPLMPYKKTGLGGVLILNWIEDASAGWKLLYRKMESPVIMPCSLPTRFRHDGASMHW